MYYAASQELRSKSYDLSNIAFSDSSLGHQEYDLYDMQIQQTSQLRPLDQPVYWNIIMMISLLCLKDNHSIWQKGPHNLMVTNFVAAKEKDRPQA